MGARGSDTGPNQEDRAYNEYRRVRIAHWDMIAGKAASWRAGGAYYHRRLREVFRAIVPPGRKVLEIGCGHGDLLAALAPQDGVGVDFSSEMIKRAAEGHPDMRFFHQDAHKIALEEKFDFIILSDLVNELWDVQSVFRSLKNVSSPQTRVVINTYSRLWELPLAAVRRLGLAKPTLLQNWLTVDDVKGLLQLADFETVRHWEEVLWPVSMPLASKLLNCVAVRFWPFRLLALTHFLVARPAPGQAANPDDAPSVSVIVPARNEAGNIEEIFARVPKMGKATEIIFVEGHSQDGTYETIEKAMERCGGSSVRLLRQTGAGKGDAVRTGFSAARGDILMILDADLTVPPEDLPRFYEVLRTGKGEFVNGVRLVYPMEKEAMRFLNFCANKFFSLAFSWLLGQFIKDTLCGTKALWKSDYERLAAGRSYFGDFDPFGDFDLLFGAAKLNLKIAEVPIRYRERTYGDTSISRWRHGWLLLRMVLFALGRFKFR